MIAAALLLLAPVHNTTDAKVSIAEARATYAGETRHHVRVRIGPVDRYTARLRPGHRTIDYATYRADSMWEVHYRWDGRWRVRWAAWEVVR